MTYRIALQNQKTGEMMAMLVEAAFPDAAQEEALLLAFRHHGWRHAVALPPWEDEARAPTGWEQAWDRFVAKAAQSIAAQTDAA